MYTYIYIYISIIQFRNYFTLSKIIEILKKLNKKKIKKIKKVKPFEIEKIIKSNLKPLAKKKD